MALVHDFLSYVIRFFAKYQASQVINNLYEFEAFDSVHQEFVMMQKSQQIYKVNFKVIESLVTCNISRCKKVCTLTTAPSLRLKNTISDILPINI